MAAVLKPIFLANFFICVAFALTKEEMSKFVARPHKENNTGLQGNVSVVQAKNKPGVLLLKSNGIPDHSTGTFPNRRNPNQIQAKNNVWRVNKNPKFAENVSCLPMGPIGMATNGVAIYNPFSKTCCDAGEEELALFDMCAGHPNGNGVYHYHIYPSCLADIVCDKPSDILGVAFDGFPIYGPMDETGKQLYKADLDECNGRMDSNGNYRYHVTKEYPYFLGCYKGIVRGDSEIKVSGCLCTKPVEVCTEFNGGGKQERQKRQTDMFTCCTNEASCNATRLFVPPDSEDSGNGSVRPMNAIASLVLSAFAAILSANFF